EQVELLFRLPVLGQLPEAAASTMAVQIADGYGSALTGQRPNSSAESRAGRSQMQEAVLSLHSALMLAAEGAPQVLAVTSALPGEGKSTVAGHFAAALAGTGQRTLLLDADMRKPSVHRNLHLG